MIFWIPNIRHNRRWSNGIRNFVHLTIYPLYMSSSMWRNIFTDKTNKQNTYMNEGDIYLSVIFWHWVHYYLYLYMSCSIHIPDTSNNTYSVPCGYPYRSSFYNAHIWILKNSLRKWVKDIIHDIHRVLNVNNTYRPLKYRLNPIPLFFVTTHAYDYVSTLYVIAYMGKRYPNCWHTSQMTGIWQTDHVVADK